MLLLMVANIECYKIVDNARKQTYQILIFTTKGFIFIVKLLYLE